MIEAKFWKELEMQFTQNLEKKAPWIGTAVILFLVLLLGTFLRLQFINKSSFPMNDGGFFYTAIRDLQQNGFHLPKYTTYNFLNIPYAYPPLSLYAAAWINQFLKVDLLTIFLYFPLIFNLISIPAFYFLSKELVENQRSALLATAFYAILNPGYEWLISGGGLTRSPAHTYFIISLTLFLVFLRTSKKWIFILSIIAGALVTLHHLEYTWVLAYSVVIFTFFSRRTLKSFVHIAVFGLGIGVITSPYWITILKYHGLSPFLSAFSTGETNFIKSFIRIVLLDFTSEPFTSFINVLAVVGIFIGVIKKKYALVAWFIAIIFLGFRSAYRLLLFPVAVFAAFSLDSLIIPGFNQIEQRIREATRMPFSRPPLSGKLFAILSIFLPFLLGFVSSLSDHPVLSSVNPEELQAMEWVKVNTDSDSSFLIINSSTDWSVDRLGEWFPAIAERHSETTVQGKEWLPDNEFMRERWFYSNFKECISEGGVPCLTSWAEQSGSTFTHLFVSKSECAWNSSNCTDYFILTVEDSNAFTKIYENEEVVIYRLKK